MDFDPDYDRQDRAESNIQEGFTDFVGADALVAKFQAYQRIAQNSKDIGLDPREQIPFNFIFRGPPGEFNGLLSKVKESQVNNFAKRHGQNDNCPEVGADNFRHGLLSHKRGRSLLCK